MHKLEYIEKKAKNSEKALKRLYNDVLKEVKAENEKNGIDWPFYDLYETDDLHGGEKKIVRDGHCVWVSNSWVSSNVIPQSMKPKVIDNRYPCKTVSYWYTPQKYMKVTQEMYDTLCKKSEREKILYEDNNIKVSMVRMNVIPFFKSYQYCHKLSHHEYVIYFNYFAPTKSVRKKIEVIKNELRTIIEREKNNEITTDERKELSRNLCSKLQKLNIKSYKWVEVAHDKNITSLFKTARHYFNDLF